ncbi:hypothetical protein Cfla_0399 [Cellulomonas flavigena DSM 20109]|uniref:Uncharacterized protein n=1 Tax=Cellulomonas flavigena (strain ATCC 482 / DSM 20109 / BCRC 11376 / JCM 18109 / NBRC 3775 / NCIMB 8073 / NRS 134) TaxID=446466 RepID=D5UHP2_CELFN|nr:hypothetical protein [Cellulomonas flavigena]ADG73316.1 hypothetical protein Cfla_0399 [Cellulomonas flavigena DSM 20109]
MGQGRIRAGAALVIALAPALVGCSGTVEGLPGRFVSVDDTGLGDNPVEDGWIAALPGVLAEDLWPDVGPAPVPDLGYLDHRIERTDVDSSGGVLAPLGRGGRFGLDVPPAPRWSATWRS